MIIDKPRAIALLEQAVAEKGADYVDRAAVESRCTYASEGCPSCIVGHAFFYAGATIEDLEDLDHRSESSIVAFIVENRLGQLPVELSIEAATAFRAAQGVQDAGGTWGWALAEAKASE